MRNKTTKIGALLAAGALTLAACSTGGGQGAAEPEGESTYPEKDITLIVQAAAGGGSDLTSRTLAASLEPILGVSIIVENRPGASGSVAMQYVRDLDPDGYTIGFGPVEIAMLDHLDFDVDPADFTYLSQIMNAPGVLSVPIDSPYDTIDEFIAAGKEQALSVANAGAGSIWEVAALGLAAEAGIDINPVPFDGGGPAMAAVIGSQVDAGVSGSGEALVAKNEGQAKPLVVFNHERLKDLPDVPTAAEAGLGNLEFGGWGGIYGPKDLPAEVVSTLETAIAEAVKSDNFVDTVTKSGNLVVYKNAKDHGEFVMSEHERFGELLG